MANCNHIIGVLHRYDSSDLVTLDELKEYTKDREEFNIALEKYGMPREKLYTLADYFDKRKSTNLTRFNYCPYCGKEIKLKK